MASAAAPFFFCPVVDHRRRNRLARIEWLRLEQSPRRHPRLAAADPAGSAVFCRRGPIRDERVRRPARALERHLDSPRPIAALLLVCFLLFFFCWFFWCCGFVLLL